MRLRQRFAAHLALLLLCCMAYAAVAPAALALAALFTAPATQQARQDTQLARLQMQARLAAPPWQVICGAKGALAADVQTPGAPALPTAPAAAADHCPFCLPVNHPALFASAAIVPAYAGLPSRTRLAAAAPDARRAMPPAWPALLARAPPSPPSPLAA